MVKCVFRKAVVELDELSTSTSSRNADQNLSRPRPKTLFIDAETGLGEDNPAFEDVHEDTPC